MYSEENDNRLEDQPYQQQPDNRYDDRHKSSKQPNQDRLLMPNLDKREDRAYDRRCESERPEKSHEARRQEMVELEVAEDLNDHWARMPILPPLQPQNEKGRREPHRRGNDRRQSINAVLSDRCDRDSNPTGGEPNCR